MKIFSLKKQPAIWYNHRHRLSGAPADKLTVCALLDCFLNVIKILDHHVYIIILACKILYSNHTRMFFMKFCHHGMFLRN